MSEKPPKHTDSVHDSWDADAFEAHAAERSNAAASPEAGKPETPQEARLRLGNIIHKFNYQEVRQPETDDETEGQTMAGHEDAKHVSQNEGTEHWQDNDARHDALNPGSYSATRRRIDALALETRGPNGIVNGVGDIDPDSAAIKNAYKNEAAEWKRNHPDGEPFPFKDRASWHRDRVEKGRQERAVKGVKETTDEEFMRTAPQLEAMLQSEKTYSNAYRKYLDERSQARSLWERLKGGATGDWSSDEKLPPDVERLRQDWYAKRAALYEARSGRNEERVNAKLKKLGATLGGASADGYRAKDKKTAERIARIVGSNDAHGHPRLSLEQRAQRRFARRDAVFGAREAELAWREQALMERHGWVGKLTEGWNKLPPPAKAVITSVTFVGAGVLAGTIGSAGGALAAVALGGTLIGARLAAEKIPADAEGSMGALRKTLIGIPTVLGSIGLAAGALGKYGRKAAYEIKGTKNKGMGAGALGAVGSAEFGGSLEDVDAARGEMRHMEDSIQNWAVVGRMAGGAATGAVLGHYGLTPTQQIGHLFHGFFGGTPAPEHLVPHDVGPAGANTAHVPHAVHAAGGHHEAPVRGHDHVGERASAPGGGHHGDSSTAHEAGSAYGGHSIGEQPPHPLQPFSAEDTHLSTDGQVLTVPVTVEAHHGLGYENLVKQLHNELAKQYPTPDAVAHAPGEVKVLLTGDIDKIAHLMAMDPKVGFYDSVHHTSVIVPPGATLSVTPGGHIMYDDGHGNLAHHGVTHDVAHRAGTVHHAGLGARAGGEERLAGYALDPRTGAHMNMAQVGAYDAARQPQVAAYDAWQAAHGAAAQHAAPAPHHDAAWEALQQKHGVPAPNHAAPAAPEHHEVPTPSPAAESSPAIFDRASLDAAVHSHGLTTQTLVEAVQAAPHLPADPSFMHMVEPGTGAVPGPMVFLGHDGALTVYGAPSQGEFHAGQLLAAKSFAEKYDHPVNVLFPDGQRGYTTIFPDGHAENHTPGWFRSYRAPEPAANSVYAFKP